MADFDFLFLLNEIALEMVKFIVMLQVTYDCHYVGEEIV